MTNELDAKIESYRQRQIGRVKLGFTDVDGVMRGKYVSLEKFEGLLRAGGGFCDCVFGWDMDDQLYDNVTLTGWHTGFPDARFRLLVNTERFLADENTPFFLAEFVAQNAQEKQDTAAGASHGVCPRSLLQRVLNRLAKLDLYPRSGFEYEFFVFSETPHSVREKHYQNLRSLTPGNFGYSVLRATTEAEGFTQLMALCDELDMPLEGLHCETGPGVWEAALSAADGITAADRAALFKTFSKVFFQKREQMATFMAKWSMDYPGQSGHYHVSLLDAQGANQFFAPDEPHQASALQRYAIAGLQRHLGDLLALVAPTINSYTRLVQGAWAPTAATWGVENRTTAIRLIAGGAKSQRLECRVPGADANPYLAAAAVLGAMCLGIEQQLVPADGVRGNAYDLEAQLDDHLRFPADLRAAAERLQHSSAAQDLFGPAFVEHFAASRLWECREHARHVSDWQLQRYFEII